VVHCRLDGRNASLLGVDAKDAIIKMADAQRYRSTWIHPVGCKHRKGRRTYIDTHCHSPSRDELPNGRLKTTDRPEGHRVPGGTNAGRASPRHHVAVSRAPEGKPPTSEWCSDAG